MGGWSVGTINRPQSQLLGVSQWQTLSVFPADPETLAMHVGLVREPVTVLWKGWAGDPGPSMSWDSTAQLLGMCLCVVSMATPYSPARGLVRPVLGAGECDGCQDLYLKKPVLCGQGGSLC
ncbi:hypothetical protein P7K49_009662 [Saguinus oedipus]|uniref:Uncharacterized protein n=1 Tax=Saguinus oedipus TaxID=9490 RepID=A0ABQ9VKK8_SAGOE|nr:hypothetical protein P7K49_009662 [Saguinus oedipus]